MFLPVLLLQFMATPALAQDLSQLPLLNVKSYDDRLIDAFAITPSAKDPSKPQFDLQAYFSHECFNPVGSQMETCTERFGPYSPLKTTIENGMLADILSDKGYDDLLPYVRTLQVTLATGLTTAFASPEPKKTAAAAMRSALDDRSQILWNLCRDAAGGDRGRQAYCFARNDRLVRDTSKQLPSSVNF